MQYSLDQINNLKQEYSKLLPAYRKLLVDLNILCKTLSSSCAQEYLVHGVGRRLNILKTCITNIYDAYPPDIKELISDKDRVTTEINLQCFVLNLYGYVDNFARVIFEEKNIPYTAPKEISFENKSLENYLSSDFINYIKSDVHKSWIEYLKDFRHSLCHRIPFYIPPYSIDPKDKEEYENIINAKFNALAQCDLLTVKKLEQNEKEICRNFSVITHSYSEKSSLVLFHPQIFCDWLKIVEFTKKIFDEFEKN